MNVIVGTKDWSACRIGGSSEVNMLIALHGQHMFESVHCLCQCVNVYMCAMVIKMNSD